MILKRADVALVAQIHESNLVDVDFLDYFLVKFDEDSVQSPEPKNWLKKILLKRNIETFEILT